MAMNNPSQQLLSSFTKEIVVSGDGSNLNEAVGSIFQTMRKQIFIEFDKPIIHLEAKEVYFEEMKIDKKTEKFLFIFMPREKQYFTITARIVVEVKYIDLKEED